MTNPRPFGVLYRTDLDPPTQPEPTPVVRRRAEELGIDVRAVRGTGVGGRVRLMDLSAPPAPAPSGASRAVGVLEVDVTTLVATPGPAADLRAVFASAALRVLAAAGAGPARLRLAVPDDEGRLRGVAVPGAGDLSLAGLTRALAGVVGGGAGADDDVSVLDVTVHDAGADGFVLEHPVVEPATPLVLSIGAPQVRAVATTEGGSLELSARWVAQVVVSSDPARVTRSVMVALAAELRRVRWTGRPA